MFKLALKPSQPGLSCRRKAANYTVVHGLKTKCLLRSRLVFIEHGKPGGAVAAWRRVSAIDHRFSCDGNDGNENEE